MSKPLIQMLQDDLNEVIDEYRGEGIVYGEVVGALELVKANIIEESREDDDDVGVF